MPNNNPPSIARGCTNFIARLTGSAEMVVVDQSIPIPTPAMSLDRKYRVARDRQACLTGDGGPAQPHLVVTLIRGRRASNGNSRVRVVVVMLVYGNPDHRLNGSACHSDVSQRVSKMPSASSSVSTIKPAV